MLRLAGGTLDVQSFNVTVPSLTVSASGAVIGSGVLNVPGGATMNSNSSLFINSGLR